MDRVVNRFIRALRAAGVRVSPAEAIDAVRALACVHIADRETSYAALRSTVLKTIHDAPLFDAVFQLFFGPAEAKDPAPAAAAETRVAAPPTPPSARQVVLDTDDDGVVLPGDESAAATAADTLRLKPGSLQEIARNLCFDQAQAILDPVMQRAAQAVHVRGATPGARPGALACDENAPTLDADLLLATLELLHEDAALADSDALAERQEQVRAVLDRLPDALREVLERRLAEQLARGREDVFGAPRRSTAQRFSEAERREMDALVKRLGRRMRSERSFVRHVGDQGRVHVARTVRASMRFDGVPFRPVVTRQIPDAPRLVVICDVSQSVRTTARFTLLLVYSLQASFERVRSFVFVSDLVEASPLFDRHGIDEAIDTIFSSRLIDCDANSNYGRALDIFVRRHLRAVTPRTTVVILGDGRGNRNPPNVGALEEIRRRAKQLVWLSPEPRGSWGIGGSDMPLYAPVCHRTEVVRNLAQLGCVADGLFRKGSQGGSHA